MATDGRQSPGSLADLLFEEPYRFDFHQAVKLLAILRPGTALPGPGARLDEETVRFRSSPESDFPASALAAIEDDLAGGPPTMTVRFFGLLGNQGPLPPPITELVQRTARAGDTALRDFLDLFHHRLLALVYSVRERNRVGLEPTSPEQHRFAGYLESLIGLGTPGLTGRMAIPDRAMLIHAGLFAQRTRSLAGLERVLSSFFDVPVTIEPFQGEWYPLDEDQRTAIGASGRNHELGSSAVLGARVWDQAASFRVILGPLELAQYVLFIPGSSGHVALSELVRLFIGETPTFRLTLKLRAEEAPPARLGDGVHDGALLGWTSWLGRAPDGAADLEVAIDRAPADSPQARAELP